jgi:hypothetical protein
MSITLRLAAPLLAVGAAAAVVAAPSAAASDNHMDCTYVSEQSTQCETPGNVQLNATPPTVSYPQQYPFLIGGYGSPIIIHHGSGGRH